MQIYDTQLSDLIDFRPDKQVNIYVCGITPYDAAHLGHIFTFLAYDLLQRRLEDSGYDVRLVRNVTDVDEPIFIRAAELGETYQELAERETKRLDDVMQSLHMRKLYAEPKASEYILEMAEAVERLLISGFGYRLENDIYFDVSRQVGFGNFSGFSDRLQLGFMADRGGDPGRAGKRNQLDFLLWRGITDIDDPAAWDMNAAIGRGRPGWHIECSIMSMALFNTPATTTPIDIHGGGMDLIFPHHECEIAQNEALRDGRNEAAPLIRHWMHVAPLSYHGEKMSKSLGNLVFAHDLLEKHGPAVIRLALMHYHYRIGGEWQDQFLERSACLVRLLQKAADYQNGIDLQPYLARIRSALDEDLNTPLILDMLHDMAADILASDRPHSRCSQDLRAIFSLLGLIAEDDGALPIRLS